MRIFLFCILCVIALQVNASAEEVGAHRDFKIKRAANLDGAIKLQAMTVLEAEEHFLGGKDSRVRQENEFKRYDESTKLAILVALQQQCKMIEEQSQMLKQQGQELKEIKQILLNQQSAAQSSSSK